jgi:predicted Zn-ribbon and HTH transcriptional regulator
MATETVHKTGPRITVQQLFCAACGYGIVVRREAPECPMCRSAAWGDRPPAARWN